MTETKAEADTCRMLWAREPRAYAPHSRHPYYIATPGFVRSSAGVKALHFLCDALRQVGEEAYIIVTPTTTREHLVGPGLDTPPLRRSTLWRHFRQRRTPIAVYPETIAGNPFRAPVLVRYVLNYPGLLGGDAQFAANEICFGYSKKLAAACGSPERSLFLPTSDPAIFFPPPPGTPRAGTCFYASKYRQFGGALLPATAESTEITRFLADSPSQQEIAALFRRSTLFYTYENTALALEAVMCGCPVVFLPNPHLQEIIGQEEHGTDGFAWGDAPAEVARARATVGAAAAHYQALLTKFWTDLDVFIDLTQAAAKTTPYRRPMRLGWFYCARGVPRPVVPFWAAYQLSKQIGVKAMLGRAVRAVVKRAKARLPAAAGR